MSNPEQNSAASYIQENGISTDKATPKKTRGANVPKEVKLAEKKARKAKLLSEVDKLDFEIDFLEKTPEEQKKYKRQLDTHCKIIAGAVALKLFKSEGQQFNRNNFINGVISVLKNFEEKEYFRKIFQ